MAYRAEIEIGVKGTRELERLRSLITQSTQAFESLNRIAAKRGGLNQTLANYETQLTRAKRAIDNVTAGTQAEVKAIREYVTAMGLANAARDRQNYLIAQEVANRRKVQATINAGFGQQGAALPPSMRNAGFGQQGPSLPPAAARRAGGGAAATLSSGNIGGIVSNAVIGGAFPLLFGQGGAAATGGALGGIVGGAFGGAGGFAGSLLGTLLGGKIGQANQIKDLATDIGFSAQQTQLLAAAFKQAGADFDKFQESVSRIQGLGLSIEDQAKAIQLASTLTDAYGGKIDKVTNAFTNALQTGKVTQATLNQLTSQGIPIQEALANKYGVSRSKLLEMAKDGKISVQDLIDTLVNLGNEGTRNISKTATTLDILKTAVGNLGTAFKTLATTIVSVMQPVLDWLGRGIANIIDITANAINEVARLIETVSRGPQAATRAALKRGELPFGTQGVGDIIGQERLQKIIKQAGPGALGFGVDQKKVIDLLLKQPEFADLKPAAPAKLTTFTAPSQLPPSGGGAKGSDKAALEAAREAERVAQLLRDTQAQTELLKIQAGLQDKIFQAEQAKDPFLVAKLQGEERILQIQSRYAELIANEPNIRAQEALVTKGLQEIENSRLQTAQAFEKIESDRLEKYNTLIEDLNLELELKNLTTEQDRERLRIEFEINRLRKDNIYSEEQLLELQRKRLALAAQDSPGQKRMKELSTSLAELTNTENLAVAAADNIGLAFSQAFQDIANGASSGQEAIANMMKSIGENFVNMAAQIIAQQITMVILGTILKALGISGGGGGGFSTNAAGFGGSVDAGIAPIPNVPDYSGVFGKKANGGPVTGGAPYLVGERGPELFVPGSSGGVMSNNDLRQSMNGGGSPVLNMSFETTRFGDTEYVSRDQLEAAMSETRRQASRDGAQRGMTMTLDRLQQSPRTRSRLGMR